MLAPSPAHRAVLALAALFATVSLTREVRATLVCDRVIDDFESSEPGSFPKTWRTKNEDEMPFAQKRHVYVVERQGKRHVLHARYQEQAITIGRRVSDWNLDEYPVLEWEWKAVKLPTEGAEDSLSKNDCGAAVYAVWEVGFPFYVDSLKYSWSTTLPIGNHIKKRLGHDHVLITESGTARLGQWRTVRVNIRDDRKRYFGTKRAPHGIAILTDADGTSSAAEAYYANFRLCRVQ